MTIDLGRYAHNVKTICERCHDRGITVAVVTKAFCADPRMVEVLDRLPVDYLADSRLQNFERYPTHQKKRMLLRLPSPSEARRTVELCDLSLNSERKTLNLLADEAEALGKRHGVVLMVDVGDLREGIYYDRPEEIFRTVETALARPSLELLGMGLNLTCYGSIIPSRHNLQRLCDLAKQVEERYHVTMPILSGGNSSSLHLLASGELPGAVTNLRLGESVLRGCETAYHQPVEGMETDAFLLEAEIIERQEKPSYPEGDVGLNAFGEQETFTDIGRRIRAIVAIGRQDTEPAGLRCLTPGTNIVGASSDHMIVDVTDAQGCQVGDVLRFSMSYAAILRGFTSSYVDRSYQ